MYSFIYSLAFSLGALLRKRVRLPLFIFRLRNVSNVTSGKNSLFLSALMTSYSTWLVFMELRP